MKNFLKIAEGIDVMPLRLAIKRQPWLWDQNTMRKYGAGTPHAQMSDIWLRYNDWANYAGDHQEFAKAHDAVWYPAYYSLPQVRPLVFGLMAQVEGERLGAVLITRIPPGGRIDAHVDGGWHAEYYDKYYVQLDSAPGAKFWCEDEVFVPKRGDVYWFDNTKLHGVENDSDEDRMTLIVCIRSNRQEVTCNPS
jgi:hypothetical protein